MSVENGPSISVSPGPAVSVAVGPSISVGPSVSAGIEASLSGRFGPSISGGPESFSSPIVNEGLVGSLEGFRLMEAFDIGSFDTFQAKLSPVDAVVELVKQEILAEANHWLGISEPRIIKEAAYWFADVEPKIVKPAELIMPQTEPVVVPRVVPMTIPNRVEHPKPQVVIAPVLEPVPQAENVLSPQASLQSGTENKISSQIVPAIATQPILEEQEVEEEIITQKMSTEETATDEEEEVTMRKKIHKIHIVDQPVLATVLSETDKAMEKGKEEAERLGLGKKILGSLVAKFLPDQHEGNAGGAVKPHGIDGTIIARRKAIAAKSEFSSEKEVSAVVFENRPVTIGEDGEPATKEEVSTTYHGRIVKPPQVIQNQENTFPSRETN